MGKLTNKKKMTRLDDTFKVLLTIFTVLLSTVVAFYGKTSPESTVFLFFIYGFTIASWSIAHLLGGEFEYFIKFTSWYGLLGGIFQSVLMLDLGTLNLSGYYFAANWMVALLIWYIVFRYVGPLLAEDLRKGLRILLFVMIFLSVVLSSLKLLGIF